MKHNRHSSTALLFVGILAAACSTDTPQQGETPQQQSENPAEDTPLNPDSGTDSRTIININIFTRQLPQREYGETANHRSEGSKEATDKGDHNELQKEEFGSCIGKESRIPRPSAWKCIPDFPVHQKTSSETDSCYGGECEKTDLNEPTSFAPIAKQSLKD